MKKPCLSRQTDNSFLLFNQLPSRRIFSGAWRWCGRLFFSLQLKRSNRHWPKPECIPIFPLKSYDVPTFSCGGSDDTPLGEAIEAQRRTGLRILWFTLPGTLLLVLQAASAITIVVLALMFERGAVNAPQAVALIVSDHTLS